MFRPTHFVILFAVFLCAYAAPSAPAVETPAKISEISPSPEAATPVLKGEGEPAKDDLETDAATHWRYMYSYGPRFGYNGVIGRTQGWGFGKKYDGWEPYVVYY